MQSMSGFCFNFVYPFTPDIQFTAVLIHVLNHGRQASFYAEIQIIFGTVYGIAVLRQSWVRFWHLSFNKRGRVHCVKQ